MRPLNTNPDPKNEKAFQIIELAVNRFKKEKPFLIGITGAGGAGKTSFGNNIAQYYGQNNCVSIDLDDYVISREERGKLGLTGYNPRANKLFLARQNIDDITSRKIIMKPRYNHTTGHVIEYEEIMPKEIVVIEGVTTLYPELRDLYDVSFFLDALEETQIKSRVERDVKTRGYTLEQALTLYEALKPDYKRFIEPTKEFATAIFEVGPDYIMHPITVSPKLK